MNSEIDGLISRLPEGKRAGYRAKFQRIQEKKSEVKLEEKRENDTTNVSNVILKAVAYLVGKLVPVVLKCETAVKNTNKELNVQSWALLSNVDELKKKLSTIGPLEIKNWPKVQKVALEQKFPAKMDVKVVNVIDLKSKVRKVHVDNPVKKVDIASKQLEEIRVDLAKLGAIGTGLKSEPAVSLISTDPTQYVPVRLTTGDKFYKAIAALSVNLSGVLSKLDTIIGSMGTSTLSNYSVSDLDDGNADYNYYGYLDKDGGWYIQREDVVNTCYRYARGTSGYDWSARASETYVTFDGAF